MNVVLNEVEARSQGFFPSFVLNIDTIPFLLFLEIPLEILGANWIGIRLENIWKFNTVIKQLFALKNQIRIRSEHREIPAFTLCYWDMK